MLSSGDIFHIDNYTFRSGKSKPKFLIILCNADGKTAISCLPSSQIFVNQSDISEGCISTDTKHCYHIPAQKTIGKNGFSFRQDTFIYFNNLQLINVEDFIKKYVDTKIASCSDTMNKDEFLELVYCGYKGNQITGRTKQSLEQLLEEINK